MEYFGHLEGMLDRDLRTTKTPVYASTEKVRESIGFSNTLIGSFVRIINHHCCHPSRTKSTSFFKWRKGYSLHHFCKNFQNVLTLGVYLILVSIPTARSAPGYNRMDPAKWTNPCGISEDETDFNAGPISNYNDSEFLETVLSSTASALNKANEFKESFTQRTLFNKPFDRAVIELTPNITKYDWLVKLPNEYVNRTTEIPREILENLKIDGALQDAYHKVQTIAVALSHTVANQERNGGRFQAEFNITLYYLRGVLCELETAMRDCSISIPPNVTSDIIPPEFLLLDKTESGPFDFVVLREYIKTLNYITKMFEYLKKNSQKIK